MRRRLMEESIVHNNFTRWITLQDIKATRAAKLDELKMQEKSWVKEGICEECGVFDILSRFENKFICDECRNIINSNNHKNKELKIKITK